MASGALGRMMAAAKHLGYEPSTRKRVVARLCADVLGTVLVKTKQGRDEVIQVYCQRFDLKPYQRKRADSRKAQSARKFMESKLGPAHPDYQFGKVNAEKFYESKDWQRLRYFVLRKHGARCMCCGATSKDGLKIHVDHILPRYHRPDLSLDPDNLQVLCEDCNMGKGAWDQTDWRP